MNVNPWISVKGWFFTNTSSHRGVRTLLVILLATLLLHMCRGHFLFTFQPFCFKLSKNVVGYIYCGYCWIYTAEHLGSNLNIISFTVKMVFNTVNGILVWYYSNFNYANKFTPLHLMKDLMLRCCSLSRRII